MGKSSKTPAAPNPASTAAAQSAANKEAVHESAKVNQINEVGPWGKLTYSGEIGSPERTRTTEYTPEGQQLYDTQQGIAQTLGSYANDKVGQLPTDRFSLGQFGDVPQVNEAYRTNYENARFDRLQPQWDRDRSQLETSLSNQGIVQGSDAYKEAIDELNRSRNDARLAIQGAGTAEMGNLYGMELQGRQQGITEYMTERNAPINELAAALQGTPATGSPQFQAPAQYQIAPADVAGLTMGNYGAQVGAANAANAANSSLMGNGIGAAGMITAASISDIRLKTNITKVGKLDSGLNVYEFNYKWGGPVQVGVMAHEVIKVVPEAVHKVGEYFAVDYSKLEAA